MLFRKNHTGWQKNWYRKSADAIRWIHIYLSMLGFSAILFFAITGRTLNHPTWLGGGAQHTEDITGNISADWLRGSPSKLDIAETLRERHRLEGRVAQFQSDQHEVMLVYKKPGYAADVFIERETGNYNVTVTSTNLIAVMNDLHKGRDSGSVWNILVIDGSAIIMLLFSLSGFALLLYIRRRRLTGLLTAVVGTLLIIGVWLWWTP